MFSPHQKTGSAIRPHLAFYESRCCEPRTQSATAPARANLDITRRLSSRIHPRERSLVLGNAVLLRVVSQVTLYAPPNRWLQPKHSHRPRRRHSSQNSTKFQTGPCPPSSFSEDGYRAAIRQCRRVSARRARARHRLQLDTLSPPHPREPAGATRR
jgi:hypothetical protein